MAKKKLKVGILMGGPSSEHEVSLSTGKMVLKNLDPGKFEASGKD
jgi:D-alanine-D-alanine ligase-like ATP-grasp enzyme